MNNKTFTLVYVFGPKRCKDKYEDNKILDGVKLTELDTDDGE